MGMMDINKHKVSFNFLNLLDIAANNRESDTLHPCAHKFWEEEEFRNSLLEILVGWYKNPKISAKRVKRHKMKQLKL